MERHKLEVTGIVGGAAAWSAPVGGDAAHRVWIVPETASVYASDGWGSTFAGLRLRRFDLESGREAATVRLGNQARCLALAGEDDLVAATDSKLFRLDRLTLRERARWTARIPRCMDSMAVRGSEVIGINWLMPSVGLIDLESGTVRRRRATQMTFVVDAPGDPLLVGGHDGGVSAIDPTSGSIRPVLAAPSACDAAVSGDGATLWLASGVVGVVTATSVGPGRSAHELIAYALDGRRPPILFELPWPIRLVSAGRDSLWLGAEGYVLELPFAVPAVGVGMWRAPRGHRVMAMDPDVRAVMTTSDPDRDRRTARLTCHRLEPRT